jgi:hypothetical protein
MITAFIIPSSCKSEGGKNSLNQTDEGYFRAVSALLEGNIMGNRWQQ